MLSEKLIHKGMYPILELCQQNLYQKVMLGKIRPSEEQSSQFNTFPLQCQTFLSLNIYKWDRNQLGFSAPEQLLRSEETTMEMRFSFLK